MSKNAKPTRKERLLDQIEEQLQTMIEELLPLDDAPGGVGRPRILPSLCLWGGFLVCVLRGMSSQLSLWRLMRSGGLWRYPRFEISDEAIYKRLASGGTSVLETLFKQVSELMRARLSRYEQPGLAPFASGVFALDVTTLDQVRRLLPALRGASKDDPVLLPGRLAAVFNIRLQQWHHVQHVNSPSENEKQTARDLLTTLPEGALIVADLGYFGFQWFDELTHDGYYWVSKLRQKTSFIPLHTFYQQGETFDGLIWLGAYRADRAAYAVRLVTFRQGRHLHRYITNVLDPQQLPLAQIAQLYARRWDIELAFKLIKRELQLHFLWSAKPVVLLQQVWAVLLISQILYALRLDIAGRAGVDPFEVSLKLMIEYLPQWALDGRDPMTSFVEDGRALGFIRPSRRIRPQTPFIPPEEMIPLPTDLVLQRTPRYAKRRC